MSQTTKVKCKCAHAQQDALHGEGVRVANATAKGDLTHTDVRCTVCKQLHRVPKSQLRN
jgi:hypothetical protein